MRTSSIQTALLPALIALLATAPRGLAADRLRVEPGLSQSVRSPEMAGHFAQDDALRTGSTGATRGTLNSPWAGSWSLTAPLRLEYERNPGRAGPLARFRYAEYLSHYRYSSVGRNRFMSRSFQILAEQEAAEHRSSDRDLEGGYRFPLGSNFDLLPFAGLRLHRLSGVRAARSFGRGVFGVEEKAVYGFTDPDHSRFAAEAFGALAGLDGEWRQGKFTLLGGLRAVSVSGTYADSNVSLLYNAGLGVNYMQGLFSVSRAGYQMSGWLWRLGGRYCPGGVWCLALELQQENYSLALPDFTGLDLASIDALALAGTGAQSEIKILPVDDREILYDRIFYAEPRGLSHTTLFAGVSIEIDFGGDARPAPPPGKPEEGKPDRKGPRETARAPAEFGTTPAAARSGRV